MVQAIKNPEPKPGSGGTPVNASIQEAEAGTGGSEFEASLVYRISSMTTRKILPPERKKDLRP